MKVLSTTIILLLTYFAMTGQQTIMGTVLNSSSQAIEFVNIVLYENDSRKLVKVTTTDEQGAFQYKNVPNGLYYIESSFIGYENAHIKSIEINDEDIVLDNISMVTNSVELEAAVIKAKRSIVEVKPDRMVFNVEGTINSIGDNALGLLRKAPGVNVDNNDNIAVLSRSGVIFYIDGKRLPLSGEDLKAYLQNISAEQIDRMDIITNPGAKYEAEGNAGIIDIRLKKNKSIGTNGSISGNLTKATFLKGNLNATGNYRNEILNTYASLGYNKGRSWTDIQFENIQNEFTTNERDEWERNHEGFNYRLGTDFFLAQNHTIGFLYSGNNTMSGSKSDNFLDISKSATPNIIDSVLIANNNDNQERNNNNFNLNYVFDNKKNSLNIDLDYGQYRNEHYYYQPNRYYNPENNSLLTEVISEYETPIEIDIYTAKADYETKLWEGKLGIGAKYSKVNTDNTFLFSDIVDDVSSLNEEKSNQFIYSENVVAGYFSYGREINKALSFQAGLRVEKTDASGDLTTFNTSVQEDPIEFEYTSYFPNAGLTYQISPMKTLSLNYGKRINRPDYNVLNPFRVQISELSYSKGNAFLKPEIVNNLELGYTLNYRYNFKLSYSKTTDQITRLIGPDDIDPRAGYITWANLAEQQIVGINISAPIQFYQWWNGYFNISASHINNQADYGEGAIVDVKAYTYSFFQQQTFNLPKGFVGEVSGYYSGPGVWGGVFIYESNWSLNLGLQKKFFNDKMNVKISANDIFKQAGWSGYSNFDGLEGTGQGYMDSRNASLSISYNFGNNKLKSRKRKTGLEEENKRIGVN